MSKAIYLLLQFFVVICYKLHFSFVCVNFWIKNIRLWNRILLILWNILASVNLQITCTLTSIQGHSAFNLRWNRVLFRVTHISYSKDSEIPSIWNRNILNQKYRELDSLINLYMLICNILRTKKHFSVYKIYHIIQCKSKISKKTATPTIVWHKPPCNLSHNITNKNNLNKSI